MLEIIPCPWLNHRPENIVPPAQDEGGNLINTAAKLYSGDVSNNWLAILIAEDNANAADPNAPMSLPFSFEFLNVSDISLTMKNFV